MTTKLRGEQLDLTDVIADIEAGLDALYLRRDGSVSFDDALTFAQITAPGVTTGKLYNVGGTLFWDGIDITGATPAGASTEIQYNDSSAFGSSANFTYDSGQYRLTHINPTGTNGGQSEIDMGGLSGGLITTGNGTTLIIKPGATGTGQSMSLLGGQGTSGNGGNLVLRGGGGNTNGGNVELLPGSGGTTNGQIIIGSNGTVTKPAVAFSLSTDTGLWRDSDDVVFNVAGFETLRIEAPTGSPLVVSPVRVAGGIRHGASGPLWTTGSGSPEGVVTAPVGSLYTNTSPTGSPLDVLYVKETGAGNTGWVAK